MSRPAVIIGVGGTGQWVLTYLKKDLIEEGNGKLPSNVRFLAFDTMPQAEVTLGNADSKNELVTVGSVRLDPDEYIHVGGDAYPLGKRIFEDRQNQRYPQIRKWFQTKFWWKALPPANWILDEGAGRIRQMGRLAVFKDVMGGNTNSLIWRSLKNAVDAVRGDVTEERKLEIIIVGSFAGGTGSGMFLDMALILRKIAENTHHILRGYFALPSVFGARQNDEMWARTFAAWRELNRFMVVDTDFPMQVSYLNNDPYFQTIADKRIFDACYLVGGRRKGTPINADARNSIFPAVAESISAVLDDEAGEAYNKYIWQNLAEKYANRAGMPLYSTVGAYTMKIPAFYKHQMASHDFSINILSALLQPRDWTVKGGGRINHLAPPDANLEKGKGVLGRQESESFLVRDVITFKHKDAIEPESVRPTLFTAKIKKIIEEKGADNAVMVEDHATAVLKDRRASVDDSSWLLSFTDLGDDPDFEDLRDEVQDEINYSLIHAYSPRKEEKAEEAGRRLVKEERSIKEVIFEHYGGETSQGEEVFGRFGDTLQKCTDFQLQLFRRMVRLWLLDTLTGRADDPIIARSGKLGYTYDFFDGLLDVLEKTRLFIEAVAAKREKEKPRLTLEGQSKKARNIMQRNIDKKFLWFFDHPDAKRSQKYYLLAMQRLVDLRKEEILHAYVADTIRDMKEICVNAQNEIRHWIWYLSTGDDPENLPGLYDSLKRSQDIVTGDHKIDQDIAEASFLKLVSEKPGEPDQAELARVLSWWIWNGHFDGNQLHLNVHLTPEEKEPEAFDALWRIAGKRRNTQAETNHNKFLKTTALYFKGDAERSNIARELASGVEFPEPRDLVDYIGDKAEPLFDPAGEEGPPQKSTIIRVDYKTGGAKTQSYFVDEDGVQGELRSINKVPRDKKDDANQISVESSSNPYKFTVVRTDDLYSHEAFRDWVECQESYRKFLFEAKGHNDPRLLHNFASEANASYYEKRIANEGGSFNPLHPKVVMLLEERDKFELAIECLLTGLIAFGDDSWQLRTKAGRRDMAIHLAIPTDNEPPDLFHALFGFLIVGRDRRQGYEQYKIDYKVTEEMVSARKDVTWGGKTEDVLYFHRDEPNGMVKKLQLMAEDRNGNLVNPEYLDLARLVTMLLNDRLERLESPAVNTDFGLPWDVVDFSAEPEVPAPMDEDGSGDLGLNEPADPTDLTW